MKRRFQPSDRSPFAPGVGRAEFEALVEEALKEIPRQFRRLIDNVAVMVEDDPPPGRDLLGLYHGVPYKHRSPGAGYGNTPPDVIVVYRRPIERICRTPDEIKEQVRLTVLHEVGHYFGLEERELREIEAEMTRAKKRRGEGGG
jgi:predicted Zn-dependent protease with MMP-like domain